MGYTRNIFAAVSDYSEFAPPNLLYRMKVIAYAAKVEQTKEF